MRENAIIKSLPEVRRLMQNNFSLILSFLSYLLHIILLLAFFFTPRPIVVPRNG